MTINPSFVKRQPDASGHNIATHQVDIGGTVYDIQAIILADQNGDCIGVPANPLSVLSANTSLVPDTFDEIDLGYTGNDLTSVVYKNGGVPQATLTLSYTAGKLSNVVRT